MKLASYLKLDTITVGLEETNVKDILTRLVRLIRDSGVDIDVNGVVEDLLKREGYCSTGIGMGLAIPHAMLDGLEKTHVAIATLKTPVEFNSVDKRPVRLVFILLGPKGETVEHLGLLARIARLCSSEMFLEMMIQSDSSDDLLKLILAEDESHIG